jgi:antitoxin MazE
MMGYVDLRLARMYSNYFKGRASFMSRSKTPTEIKVVPIGNSRGVRLPKATLAKYSIKESVLLEERPEGILLRSKNDKRLSWEETFKDMAREREDWNDLEPAIADGLDKETW